MVKGETRVTAKVTPDEDNRSLVFEWFHFEGFENRKYFQVEGTQSIFQSVIRLDEAGEWTVKAILTQNNGRTAIDSATVEVIGGNN